MAKNDIYNNQAKYEAFLNNGLEEFTKRPLKTDYRKKYFCQNQANMVYWKRLFKHFDTLDLSYIRRLRMISTFKEILFLTPLDLATIEKKHDRDAINDIIVKANKIHSSSQAQYFKADIKTLWKILFPAKDEHGLIDEKQTPYVVRHLSRKTDKSKEQRREDRFTPDEFTKIMAAFAHDVRMQALLSTIYYTFTRPQELLQRKIKDVQLVAKNYSYLDISSHGKEGTKLVLLAESNAYIMKWLDIHPLKREKEAFLFITMSKPYRQLSDANANKLLRYQLKRMGINKKISLYSFKRNGITDARLLGESDKDIQSKAGWTSTKQLQTYDIANQKEAVEMQAVKKGLIKASDKHKEIAPTTKQCPYCMTFNQIDNKSCSGCSRLLWLDDIEKEEQKKEKQLKELDEKLKKLDMALEILNNKDLLRSHVKAKVKE